MCIDMNSVAIGSSTVQNHNSSQQIILFHQFSRDIGGIKLAKARSHLQRMRRKWLKSMAGLLGLEPRLTESESVVLPIER